MPAYEPGNIPKSLYIGTDIFQAPTMDISINSDEWVKKYEAKGNEILNQSIHSLAQSEIHPVSTMLHGDAATEILNYSKNNMIDIIFVGSRGLSEVSGWLMGSVSRKLVHYASCSVLVVK
jgi:nucleotide-binding universal stress UspA family protein